MTDRCDPARPASLSAAAAWDDFNSGQKYLAGRIRRGVATIDDVVTVDGLHRAFLAAFHTDLIGSPASASVDTDSKGSNP